MKKTLFSLLLIMAPVVMFAQLKVNSNGKLQLGSAASVGANYVNNALVSIFDNPIWANWGNTSINLGLQSCIISSPSAQGNAAIFGHTAGSNTSSFCAGVWGVGTGSTNMNYGVAGGVAATPNSAGIFGTTELLPSVQISGLYAGFFDGPVYIDGSLTALSIYNLSDMRLKDDVISLSEMSDAKGRALENLQKLDVIEYNLRSATIRKDDNNDTIYNISVNSDVEAKRRHYGVSAQELQTIYPDLVLEGQDGYLAVNYSELVPILIRSIQELKQELDEMKGYGSRMTRSTYSEDNNILKECLGMYSTRTCLTPSRSRPLSASHFPMMSAMPLFASLILAARC